MHHKCPVAAAFAVLLVALSALAAGCGSDGGNDGDSLLEQIEQRGCLIAGVKYDVPLFGELKAGDADPQGFEIDLVRELAERMLGDPALVEWVQVDSASRIPKLQDGEVDLVVATLTISAERRRQIDFSHAYFAAGQSLLVKTGSPIRSTADLAGKRVSTTAGSTSAVRIRQVAPEADVQEYDGFANAFLALQLGGADAMTSDNTILWGYCAREQGVQMVGGLFTEELYGIGFQRGHADWIAYVNDFLNAIKADGTYDRLYERWFPDAVTGT